MGGNPLKVGAPPGGRILATGTDVSGCVLIDLATGGKCAFAARGLSRAVLGIVRRLLTGNSSGLLRWQLGKDEIGRMKDRKEQASPPDSSSILHPSSLNNMPQHYRIGPPRRLLSNTVDWHWGFSADGQTIAMPNYNQGAIVLHRGPPQRTVRLEPQQDVRVCAVGPEDAGSPAAAKVQPTASRSKSGKRLPVTWSKSYRSP